MLVRRAHGILGLLAVGLALAGCDDASTTTSSGGGGATGSASSGSSKATSGSSQGTTNGSTSTGSSTGAGLAAKYPGDVGIEKDPDVVWVENFEEGSTTAFFDRYDDAKPQGFAFDADRPAKSAGAASGKLTANGAGPNAVDFYKRLQPGHQELFVRYYARYQANVAWHHTGVWFGGYDPPLSYPSPQAGLKPNGDDRFAVSLEPFEGNVATPRMDFYDYWMTMHSWMDTPMGNTAYYGNSVVHEPTLVAKDAWQCFEVHVKLNPDPSSGAGAELGLWVDDQPLAAFTDAAPLGYWVKDKFCPDAATGTECTMYKPQNPTLVPLDLQWRSVATLDLNYFWPQNYITDGGSGSVWYDDMVVAKTRVGCIQ